MNRKFAITTPSETIRLDSGGQGQAVFTVTNQSGAAERALARVVPLASTQAAWLSLSGAMERDFPSGGVQAFSVSAAVPPGTAAGRYPFRLDIVSARRGSEDHETGPIVSIEVAAAAAKPANSRWWMWVAAAVFVLILGMGAWLVMKPAPASSAHAAKPSVVGPTVPLKKYWNLARGDYFSTATTDGQKAALDAGYIYVGIAGHVFPTEEKGTVPLKLYWSEARQDNYTTATTGGEKAALDAGYRLVRIEGYVFPREEKNTVPLKNYWKGVDNFTTMPSASDEAVLSNGYTFARIEGYVFPNPIP